MAKTEASKNQSTSSTKSKTAAILKAPPLKPGDKVAIVAPASRPDGPAVVAAAVHVLSGMGYVPVVGKNVLAINGYMAGTDVDRISDLNKFVQDQSVKAILCITGGYGTLRLIDQIDYDSMIKKPKIIVGSDDNTSLLTAINHVTGLVCFHGPNLDCISTAEVQNDLQQALTAVTALRPIETLDSFPSDFVYAPMPGTAEGALMGGNLTALFSLMGTKYQPDFSDKVLFLEDKNERNDVLERWLTSLHLSGELAKVNAVVMGAFEHCGTGSASNMLSLEEIFEERLSGLKKLIGFRMAIGQTSKCRYVPIGIRARVDTKLGRLEFLEPALSN
ncbi:MAG: LD-carboxypeptidase [Candidatus Melainabacteria bacterium]|nr:LD-carboxypeptidase [Candidatus Melainabacteria bacterium]